MLNVLVDILATLHECKIFFHGRLMNMDTHFLIAGSEIFSLGYSNWNVAVAICRKILATSWPLVPVPTGDQNFHSANSNLIADFFFSRYVICWTCAFELIDFYFRSVYYRPEWLWQAGMLSNSVTRASYNYISCSWILQVFIDCDMVFLA